MQSDLNIYFFLLLVLYVKVFMLEQLFFYEHIVFCVIHYTAEAAEYRACHVFPMLVTCVILSTITLLSSIPLILFFKSGSGFMIRIMS